MKKLSVKLLKKLREKYFPKIVADPKIGKLLTGDLKGLRSYRVFSDTQYRIIYQILEKEIVVIIVSIGKREKIYSRIQCKI